MFQKNRKEELLREMEDVKSIMSHLEEEYRRANISENSYQELKEKYKKIIEELEEKLRTKEESEETKIEDVEKVEKEELPETKVEDVEKVEMKEVLLETDEKKLENKEVVSGIKEVDKTESKEIEEEKKQKRGLKNIFGGLFRKKEEIVETKHVEPEKKEIVETKHVEKPPEEEKEEIEVGEIEEMTPEVIEKLAAQVAKESGVEETKVEEKEEAPEEKAETPASVEIEKLKVMIETIRESNRTVEESIRNISESIGELRSMIFHTEGSNRETVLKLERIEDEITRLKPKEIEKRFGEVNTAIEKQQILIEKLERVSEDLANKINEVHKILKSVGGIENLIGLNKEIQKKLEEMKELIKYTERLAIKTERVFIDLSKSLEDFYIYKTRQEGLEETAKELIKSVDGLNLKVDSLPTKRDLEIIKGDILVIQKQIDEINKILPVAKIKLPEPIESLKKEKEDILLFLDSLEEQLKNGYISMGEYEIAKKKNLNKLAEIESLLKKEWEAIKEFIEKGEIPEVKPPVEEKSVTSKKIKRRKRRKSGKGKPKRRKERKFYREETIKKEIPETPETEPELKTEEVEETKVEEEVPTEIKELPKDEVKEELPEIKPPVIEKKEEAPKPSFLNKLKKIFKLT